MSLKVLSSYGFENTIISVGIADKAFFSKAKLVVIVKKGFSQVIYEYLEEDIEQIDIVDEEEISTDTGQRVKNAAIGVVLLGPIGLLGAAWGGSKKLIKLRVCMRNTQALLLEVNKKECERLFLQLKGIDVQKELNDQLLKNK